MSSAAERQKKYREKMKIENPDKFKEMQRKNNENTKRKRKRIADMEPEEQAQIREKWREKKGKKKNDEVISNNNNEIKKERRIIKINYKLNAENKKLKENVRQMKTKIANIRKRLSRALKINKKIRSKLEKLQQCEIESQNKQEENDSTPYTKTQKFLQENLPSISFEEKEKVKKKLLEHNVLLTTMKDHYEKTRKISDKNILKEMVSSDIPKKYKMKTKLSSYLGLKGKIRHIQIKKKRSSLLNNLKDFYERDDISVATAGKKETKTLKKITKQRRYLLGTLNELYKKYKSEGGKISFSTFKRYRPFYILPPKLDNRDTCACKRHENLKFKAAELKSMGLIATKSLDDLLLKVVCDTKKKECGYAECENCKDKVIQFETDGKNLQESVAWSEWVLKSHEYIDKKNDDGKKVTKKMLKEKKTGTLLILMQLFTDELKEFKKHAYNIYHQYKEYQRCIKHLDEHSIAIHVDFSENYLCKLSTEIQAMHFGASRNQFTLHTGLVYSKNRSPISFTSISPCNNHGPEAIWAHLTPLLEYVKKEFPNVNSLHFFSDGPTVQYKQKKNFFLFCKFTEELGFPFSTWNFFESAHGKGAADGIGGAIKRKLDSLVSYGSDITDAECAYRLLQETDTKIILFYVPKILENVNVQLIPVPGTMAIHQLRRSDSKNKIQYRILSCFCDNTSNPGYCPCWNPKDHNLSNNNKPKQTNKKKVSKEEDKGKKRSKMPKNMKRAKEAEDSDTTVESHITFAESDSSLIDCDEIMDLEQLNEEHVIENSAIENYEAGVEQLGKKVECNPKVSILSDVRYSADNKAYHNLLKNCPLSLKEVGIAFDLCSTSSNKENLRNVYNDCIPSTSGYCDKLPIKQQTSNIRDVTVTDDSDLDLDLDITTIPLEDNERNICQEILNKESFSACKETITDLYDTNIDKKDIIIKSGESNKSIDKERRISNKTAVEIDTVSRKGHDDKNKTNDTDVNVSTVICNKTEINKIDSETDKPNKLEISISINDSVLVRYYEKKKWVYYIGFVESVEIIMQTERYFTVRFLKTVKKPLLKFVYPKKIDRDVVPEACVVKKININFDSGEYMLSNKEDYIYFC